MNHISNFLEKLRVEDGLANNTIDAYEKDLALFTAFLDQSKINIEKVLLDDLKDYLGELHDRSLRVSSVARKISCLKGFYKFLQIENIIKDNPTLFLQTPKPETKLPKFLGEDEMFKLLNCVHLDKSEFGIKLSCMLEILYAAGLRVTELVSIPMSAIQEEIDENGEKTLRNYLLIKGKGNKERIAPLNKSAIKMTLEYIKLKKELGQGDSKWLFTGVVRSKKKVEIVTKAIVKKTNHIVDKPITRQRLHQMLKELSIKAGVDPAKVHPHVIRHSFASHLLNNGVDLRVLQELLGHSNISTTEIYTHILDSKLKDLVFNSHPLAT